MKKGDVLKCVDAKKHKYLTNGRNYEVSAGDGDNGKFATSTATSVLKS